MLRGASIEFLSMYPKEREFLYPPLTFLQPVSMSKEGEYHVVEVRAHFEQGPPRVCVGASIGRVVCAMQVMPMMA